MEEELKMPDTNNCTEKEWTAWYWGKFHELCLQCTKKCKQSWIVKLSCPQFNKIEEKINV